MKDQSERLGIKGEKGALRHVESLPAEGRAGPTANTGGKLHSGSRGTGVNRGSSKNTNTTAALSCSGASR